jgi:hypothetical protein
VAVVAVDGAEAVGVGEGGFDVGAFGDDFPERLGDGGDEKEGFAGAGVPAVAEAGEVVGLDGAAAVGGVAEAGEGDERIEGAVVVGEFLADGDVADGEFEVVAEAEAVGGAGMVEEAAVVPAENVTAAGVDVGVFLKGGLGVGREAGDLFGVELLVESIEGPDDGASGKRAGGENAPADVIIYETQFGVGVDHKVAWMCMAVLKSNWSTKRSTICNSVCNRVGESRHADFWRISLNGNYWGMAFMAFTFNRVAKAWGYDYSRVQAQNGNPQVGGIGRKAA